MKRLFIVGNWKANKTTLEAKTWLQEISNSQFLISNNEKEKILIVCPGFHELSKVKEYVDELSLPFAIGAQDVSAFPAGAHTGEVTAEQIKEFAEYAIIGHSERRKLGDSLEQFESKVSLAIRSGITIIYCVRHAEDPIPLGVTIAAYEPVTAIGSGHPDTPENAGKIAEEIKQTYSHVQFVLYGGSVTPENVSSYTSLPSVDGVLVGGASLDATSFAQIIQNS